MPIQNLRVFGKSEQVQTTGAQLFNESQIGQYNERAFKYFNIPVGEGNFTLSSNIPKSLTDSSAYIMLISGNVQHLAPEINTSTNGVYSGQSRTFPSMNGYVTIAYRNDANTDNLVTFNKYWYMLNTGETAKPYEPYTGGKPSPSPEYPQEVTIAGENGTIDLEITGENVGPQSLTLSTPNGLPGIKVDSGGNYTDENGQQWICDEIDLARGKYIQRIGRKIFDGAENWSHKITKKHKNNNFQMMIENEKGTINHRSVCNYIRFTNLAWDDVLENLPKIYAYDSQITASFPPESEINSLETWKNYLKEKGDFEIQYVFETPTETELTPETIAAFKILHSNYPTTVISNDENAGMEVSYVADTKHYIDKKFEELNQAIVNTQIALL